MRIIWTTLFVMDNVKYWSSVKRSLNGSIYCNSRYLRIGAVTVDKILLLLLRLVNSTFLSTHTSRSHKNRNNFAFDWCTISYSKSHPSKDLHIVHRAILFQSVVEKQFKICLKLEIYRVHVPSTFYAYVLSRNEYKNNRLKQPSLNEFVKIAITLLLIIKCYSTRAKSSGNMTSEKKKKQWSN